MANGARRSSRRLRHPRPAARPRFGHLALVVLVLGLVLWPALTAPAQQPPGTTPQAPPAPPPATTPAPPALPPAPAPADQPNPPQLPATTRPEVPQPGVPLPAPQMPGPQRFEFKIDPKTPLKDLLPAPPKVTKVAGPFLSEDLARVPEVQFQAPLVLPLNAEAAQAANLEATRQTAHLIARINHLNSKKTDGFLLALTGERADLAGLPFAMGDACRTKGERSRQFALAVGSVRQALRGPQQAAAFTMPSTVAAVPGGSASVRQVVANSAPIAPVAVINDPGPAGENFWEQYRTICNQEDKTLARVDQDRREHVTCARIAALMQVLAPETTSMRLGLVEYLAGVSHVEATKALARLALFSAEDEVRKAAVDALKVRRERDYTGVLEEGLHYPLPAVAKRAADAIVKLERTDLLPKLVALLEEPDPRAPAVKEVNSKRVPVVRELVRVNHHQSCLLCHAPANTGKVAPETLTAAVPNPTEPLSAPSQGYGQAVSPDVTVRIDVTYLRQDFSMLQPVADANPWPEMQRFDFLVRARALTDDEAKTYREKIEQREPGQPSAYQRVALAALREMTGKDAEPTPEAWRRLLKLPAQER